jgi:hypothetical protein
VYRESALVPHTDPMCGMAVDPGSAAAMSASPLSVDIRHPFREGNLIPVTLRFERAGEVATRLRVMRLGAKTHSH